MAAEQLSTTNGIVPLRLSGDSTAMLPEIESYAGLQKTCAAERPVSLARVRLPVRLT
jgi:hypothetical protein